MPVGDWPLVGDPGEPVPVPSVGGSVGSPVPGSLPVGWVPVVPEVPVGVQGVESGSVGSAVPVVSDASVQEPSPEFVPVDELVLESVVSVLVPPSVLKLSASLEAAEEPPVACALSACFVVGGGVVGGSAGASALGVETNCVGAGAAAGIAGA